MTTKSDLNSLREIVHISDGLCKALCVAKQGDLKSENAHPTDVTFAMKETASLEAHLTQLNISPSSRKVLIDLWASKQTAFTQTATQEYRALLRTLASVKLAPAFFRILEATVRQMISRVDEESQNAILEVVGRKVAEFSSESNSLEEVLSSSDEAEVCRGHSKLATTILEKAFQYASNITAAERNKLASATGLKPKQVTIWYQNRRNRKIAAKPFPPETKHQLSKSNVVQKRKRAELYGEMPRYPTHRMRLSSDSWVARTEEEMDKALDLSSSRSSSFETNHSDRSGSRQDGVSVSCTSASSFDSTCDYQIHQTPFAEDDEHNCIEGREPANMKDEYIFDGLGQARLDFEDLELDVATIKAQLQTFKTHHSSEYSKFEHGSLRGVDVEAETGRAEIFPPFGEIFYNSIDKTYITTESLVQPFLSKPCWEELWSSLISRSSTGADATLSLHSNDSIPASAESSSSTSMPKPLSHLDSDIRCSPFDFSLDGLGLSEIVMENEDTFYGQSLYTQFLQHEPHVFEPFRAGTTFVDEDWI